MRQWEVNYIKIRVYYAFEGGDFLDDCEAEA